MGAVRDYFSQFGDVTNVAIEGNSRRALVSFASNREAYKAWKSDDAVFGSRHVKVLWHRPLPGQGGAGQKKLEASAELISNMKRLENGDGAALQGDVVARLDGPESRLRKTLAELEVKEKRQKRETLMAEQKVLFARASGASAEDKAAILTRVKEIAQDLKDLDKPAPPVDLSDKEKLDAELAKHGMETTSGKDDEELLKLNAQLTALRDKASTMGIPSSRYSPYGRGASRGAARARGRGRGRGGFNRPMSLDNRSKTVLVSSDGLASEQEHAAVREWYESSGGSVAVGDDGAVLVTYPSREMAEEALSRGTAIPGVAAPLKAAWHNTAPHSSSGPQTPVEMVEDGEVEVDMEDGERRERD
jgi:RNA-binding protein 26